MPRWLMKIAGMASSSKRRRTSSSKTSGADGARVLSVKRTDTLPRKGLASTGRRKPIAEPPAAAPTEPLAKGGAGSKKAALRREQAESAGSRTKAPRAAGRASGERKKRAAKVVTGMSPAVVEAATPSVVIDEHSGAAVDAPVNDESAMTVLEAPAVGAFAAAETEIVVEPSAILEETTIAMPVAPGVDSAKRGLVRTVSWLLSTLRRWTGPRL